MTLTISVIKFKWKEVDRFAWLFSLLHHVSRGLWPQSPAVVFKPQFKTKCIRLHIPLLLIFIGYGFSRWALTAKYRPFISDFCNKEMLLISINVIYELLRIAMAVRCLRTRQTGRTSAKTRCGEISLFLESAHFSFQFLQQKTRETKEGDQKESTNESRIKRG